jgi:hypothetical protein
MILLRIMGVVYEIHKYLHENFQYVVARTNKYSENKVKNDVERMNAMLSESLKTMGTRYVFAISNTFDSISKERKKKSY